jgi:hypothetical protein
MVYNIENQLSSGNIYNKIIILNKILKYNIIIRTFRKLVRLPSSGDGRGDTFSDGSF